MSIPFITFVRLNHIQQSMSKMRLSIATLLLLVTTVALADMPRDYYPDHLEGRNKGDLKTELHKLIKEHRRIEYGGKGTWVVFRESDIRPDGTVWDMYSNIERYFKASGATSGMNIEHSVPKSWWGDDYPYTVDGSFDLHHLVPSDATANSKKSNYPLGEVSGTPSFDNGVSKVGYDSANRFNVFEPADEYKGDFARMYMYFVTCYQDYSWRSLGTNMFITGSYPTLNSYSVSLLMRWHRQDPVSKKERDRNDAVYRHQYNRNPYIDYPQLAEYIWGDSTEYVFSFEGSSVEAPSLNIKSGEVIAFDGIAGDESRSIEYKLKGRNITSNLYLSVENTQDFDVMPRTITPEQVMSGITITITYHPQSAGTHRSRLVIEGDDFANNVEVVLQGLCLSGEPMFVKIKGLKSSYSQRDADVSLSLLNYTEPVVWYIDGASVSGNTFSPSSLELGRHTITFENASLRGEVNITITQ